jgi:hypothetical protein
MSAYAARMTTDCGDRSPSLFCPSDVGRRADLAPNAVEVEHRQSREAHSGATRQTTAGSGLMPLCVRIDLWHLLSQLAELLAGQP